ncbi:hypothetical protein [Lacrimispora sp.]|uniref:hypothetical protein n=1 Tax=Lacrimispora sp. TaxID=2719234 RepID=UPI0028AE8C7D|nr:hypothetical protein [Lacrimispora sp.]
MKNYIKLIKLRLTSAEVLKEDKEELRNTKWLAEFIKGAIVSVMTITILFCMRQYSPGNKSGAELEKYLKSKICASIKEISLNDMKIVIPYSGSYESLSDSSVLVTYSKYTTAGNRGRVIALFERENESLLNQIIGSAPAYDVSFIKFIEEDYPDDNILYYTGVDVRDIDSDGNSDIFLSLQTNYASRITRAHVLLTKKDGEWKLVSPQPEVFSKEEAKIDAKGYSLYYDVYDFKNPYDNIVERIYGLSHNGNVYVVENPLLGGVDLCYEIGANDGTIGSSFNTHYAYFMFQLVNGKLIKDDNWNGGEPLILESGSNFADYKDSYWGYAPGTNLWFYGPLDSEESNK